MWAPVSALLSTSLPSLWLLVCVQVSFETGTTTSYALFSCQDRGNLLLGPGVEVYKGQIIGQHQRPGDLELNACKRKAATNIRSNKDATGMPPLVCLRLLGCPPLQALLPCAVCSGPSCVFQHLGVRARLAVPLYSTAMMHQGWAIATVQQKVRAKR